MGLSAFNAMRARQKAKEAAEKIAAGEKIETAETEASEKTENVFQKKKTDAEKLKNKKD